MCPALHFYKLLHGGRGERGKGREERWEGEGEEGGEGGTEGGRGGREGRKRRGGNPAQTFACSGVGCFPDKLLSPWSTGSGDRIAVSFILDFIVMFPSTCLADGVKSKNLQSSCLELLIALF